MAPQEKLETTPSKATPVEEKKKPKPPVTKTPLKGILI